MDSHSVLHHSFADDTQLQKSAPPQQVDELIQSMQQCVHDIKSWTTQGKLKLNDDKTEKHWSYLRQGFQTLYLFLNLLL